MRRSKDGKGSSVYIEIAMWADADEIHVTTGSDKDVPDFHIAVGRDQSKPNGHSALFKHLTECLRKAGAPYPTAPITRVEG